MWAQLITMPVKDGSDDAVAAMLQHLSDIEMPDSGWVGTTAMRDRSDVNRLMVLVVFESEEKARARESDPRRADGLATLRTMMGEILAGPPEFAEFDVVDSTAPGR